MAGTRQRSRISDTIILQEQRSVANTASSMMNTSVADALQIPESADEDSHSSGSTLNRSAKGFCRDCGSAVGDFYNSWCRITSSVSVIDNGIA